LHDINTKREDTKKGGSLPCYVKTDINARKGIPLPCCVENGVERGLFLAASKTS